jgi:hypothetical protein
MKDAIWRDVPDAKKGLYRAGASSNKTLTRLVENTIKEDILNRLVHPAYFP